jgi:hypothetical protein
MLNVDMPLAEGPISHLELCFECWFVETGQGSSGIGGFKLGRRDPLRPVLRLVSLTKYFFNYIYSETNSESQ